MNITLNHHQSCVYICVYVCTVSPLCCAVCHSSCWELWLVRTHKGALSPAGLRFAHWAEGNHPARLCKCAFMWWGIPSSNTTPDWTHAWNIFWYGAFLSSPRIHGNAPDSNFFVSELTSETFQTWNSMINMIWAHNVWLMFPLTDRLYIFLYLQDLAYPHLFQWPLLSLSGLFSTWPTLSAVPLAPRNSCKQPLEHR